MHKTIPKIKISLLKLILISSSFYSISYAGENIILQGIILDSLSNEYISSVNIKVENTQYGTTSDETGKFKLEFQSENKINQISFSHIGYKNKKITIRSDPTDLTSITSPTDLTNPTDLTSLTIKLHTKIINYDPVKVYETAYEHDYGMTLKNEIISIETEAQQLKGIRDITDVLATDQRISINESLNGKKNISIRGLPEDELVILLNGIQINSNFSNNFDLSLIDAGNYSHIEIILGNSLAAANAIGSAATINLIPKTKSDKFLEVSRTVGNYNTENWRFNSFLTLRNLNIYGGYTDKINTLNYAEVDSGVINSGQSTMLNLKYNFTGTHDRFYPKSVEVNYFNSIKNHENNYYYENLKQESSVKNFLTQWKLASSGLLKANLSKQEMLEENEFYLFDSLRQNEITGETDLINLEYNSKSKNYEYYLNYTKNSDQIAYKDLEIDSNFKRDNTWISAGLTTSNYSNDDNKIFTVQFNITNNRLKDYSKYFSYENRVINYFSNISFDGYNGDFQYHSYANIGNSNKNSSLNQQMMKVIFPMVSDDTLNIDTQLKKTAEIGFRASNNKLQGPIAFMNTGISIFRYSYENKFITIPFSSHFFPLYDNHSDATLSGFEVYYSLSFFNNLIRLNANSAKYIFSSDAAFPLKPKINHKVNLDMKLKFMKFGLNWYYEGEKKGIIAYNAPGGDYVFKENVLKEHNNINVNIGINSNIKKLDFNIIFNAYNLIENKQQFNGILLFEKKYYLTLELGF